jgi:hypothetical protein
VSHNPVAKRLGWPGVNDVELFFFATQSETKIS